MNRFDHQWQKLTALARQAPPAAAAAPLGFATRVVARAATAPAPDPWAVVNWFAWRGLLVAAACGVAAVVMNYSALQSDQAVDYATVDTVGELLDFS
jgi:hypothetical protein